MCLILRYVEDERFGEKSSRMFLYTNSVSFPSKSLENIDRHAFLSLSIQKTRTLRLVVLCYSNSISGGDIQPRRNIGPVSGPAGLSLARADCESSEKLDGGCLERDTV